MHYDKILSGFNYIALGKNQSKYMQEVRDMGKKTKVFWMIRIAAVLVLLMAGTFFAVSKKYFDTSYNRIQEFREIESVELRQGDVLTQTLFFNMDKINSVGICAVNRTNNCEGIIGISIADGNNSIIWEDTVDAGAIDLQRMTWFKVKQPVEEQEEYTLILSADEMNGVIHIGAIDADKSSNGVTENAVKNGAELSKPIVVETTFYARLDKQMKLLIFIWTVTMIIYIMGFEKLFLNKKRGTVTLALTVEILILSIYFRSGFAFKESLNYIMFAGLAAAFSITALIYIFMLYKDVCRVEWYFAVSTLIFGIVYSLILPPFSMSDEGAHFEQAYRLSNAIMGQPVNDEHGCIYMRECDISDRGSYLDNGYTIDILKALIRGNNDASETLIPDGSMRNLNSSAAKNDAIIKLNGPADLSASVIMYLAQAAGITIGKILHFNYVRLVYMGRLMNLIMFIFITYHAIKIIPYGKWVFWAICQIPMVLETVSSQSYDTLILAMTFLFVAYLLKLCVQQTKITMKNLFILTIIVFFSVPLKPVYVPFAALVFLLPDENISDIKWKSLTCKLAIMGAAILAVLLAHKFHIGVMSQIKDSIIYAEDTKTVSDEGMEKEQEESYIIKDNDPVGLPSKEFLIENPFNVVESYMGAFIVYADEYWLALFGCGLSHLWDLRNPAYIGMMTILLLYISYKKDSGQGEYIAGLKGRLWVIFLMAGSLAAIFLAMYLGYTRASIKVVRGVQGRYMLPLLIALPMFLKKYDRNLITKESVIMFSHVIQVLAILSVCMQIWNR